MAFLTIVLCLGALTTTQAQKDWQFISSSKACQSNDEGITSFKQTGRPTVEGCQAYCLANAGCVAIDYYRKSKHCRLYDTACNNPKAGHQKASSYKYEVTTTTTTTITTTTSDTRLTCKGFDCASPCLTSDAKFFSAGTLKNQPGKIFCANPKGGCTQTECCVPPTTTTVTTTTVTTTTTRLSCKGFDCASPCLTGDAKFPSSGALKNHPENIFCVNPKGSGCTQTECCIPPTTTTVSTTTVTTTTVTTTTTKLSCKGFDCASPCLTSDVKFFSAGTLKNQPGNIFCANPKGGCTQTECCVPPTTTTITTTTVTTTTTNVDCSTFDCNGGGPCVVPWPAKSHPSTHTCPQTGCTKDMCCVRPIVTTVTYTTTTVTNPCAVQAPAQTMPKTRLYSDKEGAVLAQKNDEKAAGKKNAMSWGMLSLGMFAMIAFLGGVGVSLRRRVVSARNTRGFLTLPTEVGDIEALDDNLLE